MMGQLCNAIKDPINNKINISNLSRGSYIIEVKVNRTIARKLWIKA